MLTRKLSLLVALGTFLVVTGAAQGQKRSPDLVQPPVDEHGSHVTDAQVIAFSCMHKEECLAVVVLFRNKADRFTEDLAGTLDTLRCIFAEQLSNIIKIHHRAKPSWPDEAVDGGLDYEGDDYGFGFEGGLAA